MRRLPPMPSRTAIRWLLWAACWSFCLLASRLAHAAAPMCDERGASAIAPTPVLQARDVKIDAGTPLGCDVSVVIVARPGWRAHQRAVVVTDSFDDAWVRPTPHGLPRSTSGRNLALSLQSLPVSAEHGRGVFRPPRG